MLTVTITILALLAASAIAWYGFRRMRTIQQVSGQLSGPVEEMREQLLLTADSAVDRLDGKMAQMEILLAELDRRSNLLAQQSQRQQVLHSQLEQQQQQLAEWFAQQHRLIEKEAALARQMIENQKEMQQQTFPILQTETSQRTQELPKKRSVASIQPEIISLPVEKARPDSLPPRMMRAIAVASPSSQGLPDKRTLMLNLAEQGMSAEDIAKKLGVGKGEVMLLLKLRKKATHE